MDEFSVKSKLRQVSTEEDESKLRFVTFSSFVSTSFWFKACDIKLDEDMLNNVERHIWGYYSASTRVGDLAIDESSFNSEFDTERPFLRAHGMYMNLNTIEEFRTIKKTKIIQEYGKRLLEDIINGNSVDDPTVADSSYTYILESSQTLDSILTSEQRFVLGKLHDEIPVSQKGFFMFTLDNSGIVLKTIREFVETHTDADFESKQFYIAFLDPTSISDIPGWPLRNLLILLKTHCGTLCKTSLKIVSIQGDRSNWFKESRVLTIKMKENEVVDGTSEFRYIGWEKNLSGRLGPRSVSLNNNMCAVRLATSSLYMNLKLMKWRIQPNLNLDPLKQTSCLILGAGTLGCSVARNLVAWGVTEITFVDNGFVRYSNPPRQSLYTYEDSVQGVLKAMAAGNALKSLNPAIHSQGIFLQIPVPGNDDYDEHDIDTLVTLIDAHDVIFLVTDSRESRWLPTVIGSFMKKLVITIALGYDSYVVSRHGIDDENRIEKLACYFCNDVTAPGNSEKDRTLDQQCTVSRPGVASIASSIGVELMVSILQHPMRELAYSNAETCLGKVPQSVRGNLVDYSIFLLNNTAFEKCVACSSKIVNEYEKHKNAFLKRVFSDSQYLEELSGVAEYNDDILEGFDPKTWISTKISNPCKRFIVNSYKYHMDRSSERLM